jgi:hypothetical protein
LSQVAAAMESGTLAGHALDDAERALAAAANAALATEADATRQAVRASAAAAASAFLQMEADTALAALPPPAAAESQPVEEEEAVQPVDAVMEEWEKLGRGLKDAGEYAVKQTRVSVVT